MAAHLPSIEAIFSEALEIPSDEERAAYLDRACAAGSELRQHVESLIAAHGRVGRFLASPTVSFEHGPPEPVGETVGPYKLLEPIGEGGMGIVYMAEQTRPVRRKVALKIIKPGMDTKQVIARFEAERQALAMMDHPNIARVLDAGATQSGRPYFVMELVRGLPITDYCDRNRLPIEDRLELFALVCQAVQHAHQKGIIHRDLKPGNVLVTMIDGAAVPRIIDFGVAKAMGQQLTEKTLFTGFAQLIGTPLYMSPEQAEFSGVDVDTRSDIYSLGVLLYELLTGTTPFDQETFRTAAYDEIRRIIREQVPPRPSTRISTLAGTATTVSTNRQTDPQHLRGSLSGELDWIVMKALEKDRNRRYETANDFAADVRRYLTDKPVEACPPSVWYRFRKSARRHRIALTAATLVSLALVAGTAVSAWQAVRATRAERESARQSGLALAAAEAVRDREINLRNQAEDFAEQSRRRQVELSLENGSRLMDEGDLAGSLPWFVEVLRLDGADPARAEIHRIRLAATLAQCPKPTRLRFDDRTPVSAELSPDGRAVAIAFADGTVLVHDVAGGRDIGPTLRHLGRVSQLRFSPDGRRLLTCGYDRMARIWEIATGREVVPPLQHEGKVLWGAFNPDGSRVVTNCLTPPDLVAGVCRLWDAATGRPITGPFRGGRPAFSPDGRFLATGEALPARLYHARTGEPVDPPLPPGVSASGWTMHPRSFSPDGRRLVTMEGGGVRIWDTQTGRPALPPLELASPPGFASFSPDGRWLAVTLRDGTVHVVNPSTGVTRGVTLRHAGFVGAAYFNPDGTRILTACNDNAARIWDASTGRLLFSPMWHAGFNWESVRFSPEGRFVFSVGFDRTMWLWDLATASPDRLVLPHAAAAYEAAFSPDGRMLATVGSRKVWFWDAATGELLGPLLGHPEAFGDVCRFSPDGRLVLTISGGGMGGHFDAWIWDVASRKVVAGPLRHSFTTPIEAVPPRFAVWSPDGRRVAVAMGAGPIGTTPCQIRVWEARTGAPVSPMLTTDTTVQDLEFSPDGELLAIASGVLYHDVRPGEARVLDASTGLPRIPPISTPSVCRMVRFSPDGRRLVTACGDMWYVDCQVRVWDADTGRALTPPSRHDDRLSSVAFSPDGRSVVSTSWDGTAQLWDAATGARKRPPMRHLYPVHSAAFSPDGRFILTSSSPTGLLAEKRAYAQVWDAASGHRVTPPLWHTRAITSAVFGPDSRRFATTSYGDGAQVWKLEPDPRPIDDLSRLAQILSSTTIDDTGVQRTLETAEIRQADEVLRARDPGVFTASPNQVMGSHFEQVAACEAARSWEAALGHLDALIASGRGGAVLRRRRAQVRAELDRWREAAEDYRGLSDGDGFYDWYSLAVLELGGGDREGYRAACSAMLRLFGGPDSSGEAAEFAAWTCAVGPDALDDLTPALTLAERLHQAKQEDAMIATTLGAMLYRAGRFAEAVARLDAAAQSPEDGRTSPVYGWLFLAMGHHRLGHADEARRWFDRAAAAIDKAMTDHNSGAEPLQFRRRLTLTLLRDEAAALLGLAELPADVFARPGAG